MRFIALLALVLGFSIPCCAALAAEEAVSFATAPLWLSTTHVVEGQGVRVQTVVMKNGTEDVSGSVSFYDGTNLIGTTDFSLPSSVGGTVVSVSWTPTKGSHAISAKITKASRTLAGKEENIAVTQEIKANDKLTVDPDNDRDGIADATDPDDDNDMVSDVDEKKNGTNPLVKEPPKVATTSQVAATAAATASSSKTDILSKATDVAKNSGSLMFDTTESFRTAASDYFENKLKAADAAKLAKQNSATATPDLDVDKILVAKPKSITDQISDSSGILEGIVAQIYKALAFLFGNIFAFYILSIFLIVWIIRKIWKRYSLD